MTASAVVLVGLILLFALLVYPGELSQLSVGSNRWLYDCSSRTYERKWRAEAYRCDKTRMRLLDYARSALQRTGVNQILDVGCGTGRGIRLALGGLGDDVCCTGIDFSAGMLAQLRNWLNTDGAPYSRRVQLIERELGDWSRGEIKERFGVVFFLEVGEFLPKFAAVLSGIADVTVPGGGIIMTRPAGIWWTFFPGRQQSRNRIKKLLVELGYEDVEFVAWRCRYELVFGRKTSQGA